MDYIYSCGSCGISFVSRIEILECVLCDSEILFTTIANESLSTSNVNDSTFMDVLNQGMLDSFNGSYLQSEDANQVHGEIGERVLSPMVKIDKLHVVEIDQSLLTAVNECMICLEEFELKSKAFQLSCSHLFHVSCLERWFQGHRTCPLCRNAIERSAQEGDHGAFEEVENVW